MLTDGSCLLEQAIVIDSGCEINRECQKGRLVEIDLDEVILSPSCSIAVERERAKTRSPEETGETNRVPVTQEYMAMVVAGKYSSGNHIEELFTNLLYESVSGLVYSLAKKYALNSRDDVDDLVNDCAFRIFQKIGTFDPMKAKFTTWCWRVCGSVLDRKYRKSRKHTDRLSAYDGLEEVIACETDNISTISEDMREVVRALFVDHPEKREILVAMFGEEDNLFMPDRICVTQISREVGIPYRKIDIFLRNHIRPVFAKKFGRNS